FLDQAIVQIQAEMKTTTACTTTTATTTTSTTTTTSINTSRNTPNTKPRTRTRLQAILRPTPTSLLLCVDAATVLHEMMESMKCRLPGLGLRLKRINHLSLSYWDDDAVVSAKELEARVRDVDEAQSLIKVLCPQIKHLESHQGAEADKEEEKEEEEDTLEWDVVLYSIFGRVRSRDASYPLVEVKRWML
ncbi:hypothetical protein BGZ94_004236, partial [Podila epigama]